MAGNASGFFFSNPNGMGGTFGTPLAGYGDTQAVNQENSWASILSKYPSLYPGARAGFGTGAFGAPSSAWGPLPTGGSPGPGNAQNYGTTPGFGTLQAAKSPAGNAALDAILGRTSGLSNDPNQPVNATTKDPAIQGQITGAGQTLASGTGQANQTMADFTKNFLAGDPQAKSFETQETGAIGNWYGPASDPNSVTASLAKLNNQRAQAVQGALTRARDAATRTGNINRLGMGGDSSYANQQFMDTAAGINANEAATEADLNRQNFLTVANGQNQLAGRRAGLLGDYLTRDLVPIQAGQQLQATELGNLGNLSTIQSGNRIYQTPEQLLAARLGLLGQYGSDLNSLNLFGVGGQFGSPSFPPINRPGFAPPNYDPTSGTGSTGMMPPINAQGYGTGATPAAAPSQNLDPRLRQAYFQTTGVYPENDPHFSMELVRYLQANTPLLNTPNNPTPDPAAGLPVASGTDLSAGYFPQPAEYYGG